MTTHDDTANIMRELERELGVRGPANVLRAALNIAKEAAAQAKAANPQPVDPAWMVEVAREARALSAEEAGLGGVAANLRDGKQDEGAAMASHIRALRLALSCGHVVLAPVMPSEEEMLRGAREDAAQVQEANGDPTVARETRSGARDHGYAMRVALQARRNVYASLGAVAGQAVSSGPVVPEVDLLKAASKAWANGFTAAIDALQNFGERPDYQVEREKDVSAILENLKSGEA